MAGYIRVSVIVAEQLVGLCVNVGKVYVAPVAPTS